MSEKERDFQNENKRDYVMLRIFLTVASNVKLLKDIFTNNKDD